MWKVTTATVFGALGGLVAGLLQFPEMKDFFYPAITITVGIFVFYFSNSLLEK